MAADPRCDVTLEEQWIPSDLKRFNCAVRIVIVNSVSSVCLDMVRQLFMEFSDCLHGVKSRIFLQTGIHEIRREPSAHFVQIVIHWNEDVLLCRSDLNLWIVGYQGVPGFVLPAVTGLKWLRDGIEKLGLIQTGRNKSGGKPLASPTCYSSIGFRTFFLWTVTFVNGLGLVCQWVTGCKKR